MDIRRKTSKPKTRWFTDMENDMRTGVINWRKKAEDRIKWFGVIREVKGKLNDS